MKGFHVCKAGNAPTIGQVKSLIVVGDRIKSKPLDQGGQNYVIRSAIQRESYSDSYGNVGYDIEIEPANGAQSAPPQAQAGTSSVGIMSREDYWRNKDQRDIDAIPRMTRSHSQEMAIRTVAILMANGLVSTPEEMKVKLKELTDYYQRDVGRMPVTKKQQGEPYQNENPVVPDEPEGEDVF